jgi:hypothetical protein
MTLSRATVTKWEHIMTSIAHSRKSISYFNIFDIFTLSFAIGMVTQFAGLPDIASWAWFATVVLGFFVLLKRRDEFAESCWRTAASAGFGIILVYLILAPYMLGFTSGMLEVFLNRPVDLAHYHVFDEATAALLVQIAVVITVFQYKRFRGLGA